MVRISVRVSGGSASFTVMVQAESIERALEIARHHNPTADCKLCFPIDPESFFVEDRVPKLEAVETAA